MTDMRDTFDKAKLDALLVKFSLILATREVADKIPAENTEDLGARPNVHLVLRTLFGASQVLLLQWVKR